MVWRPIVSSAPVAQPLEPYRSRIAGHRR